MKYFSRVAAAVAVLLLLIGLGTQAQQATPEATPEASPFSIPPEIAGHEQEWPLGNHDYANTRVAVNSSINAANVNTLGAAWTYSIPAGGSYGAAAGNPVISGGRVYVQDLTANTYALDLATGSQLWKAEYNNGILGPGGPGIGYGKVFVVSRVDQFSALDINTGKELWKYATGNARPSGAIQPYAFDNQLYITTQAGVGGQGAVQFRGYQSGASGVIFAINPDTGQPSWQFQTVADNFWGHPEINSGGGVWYPPAIDTATGDTYWGVGNPAPFAGIAGYPNGSSRPGDNLYTDSIISLDHLSGKLLWYHQVTPHDILDHDFQISPILTSLTIKGAQKNVVIGGGKGGRIIAFDRSDGTPLWDTPVGKHENDTLTEIPAGQTVWVYPGLQGGVETPMAYADNTIYALVTNWPAPYNATSWDSKDGTEAVNKIEGQTAMKDGTSEVDALDATTGAIKWKIEFNQIAFGAATVVNDLLFTATFDGTIYALSRENGHTVWQYKAPGGINAWPAVAGDTIVWPVGIGDTPVILALRLGANAAAPTPPQQRTPVGAPANS